MMVSKKKLRYFLYLEIILLTLFFYKSSASLSAFVDEYLSLSSNSNFFKDFDFNAGPVGEGSYSVILTSGPLSAVGSVIGWTLTKDLILARCFNFIFALLLHIIFIREIKKHYSINEHLLLIYSSFSLVILPWYFGVLYSLGEVTSTIIFFYGLLLFEPRRRLSLILLSSSIFFGKLILLFLFVIFYFTYIFLTNEYKSLFTDVAFFSLPFVLWITFVAFYYSKGNIFDYIYDFVYFNFINNRSAGVKEVATYSVFDYIFSYKNSEVINWQLADLLRVLVSPILFICIAFFTLNNSTYKFRILIISIITSTSSLFFWFWILSPTKWIRYSQHFLLLQILLIFLILSLKSLKINSDLYLIIIAIYFSLFLSSSLLIVLFLLVMLIVKYLNKFDFIKLFPNLLAIALLINLINAYFELNSKTEFKFELETCIEALDTRECYQEYINN